MEESERSGTGDWGMSDLLPVDMDVGHFMMHTQSGAICWRPSGPFQPEASAYWVVLNDMPPSDDDDEKCGARGISVNFETT